MRAAWLIWALAPVVLVGGGCAATPVITADRPTATVTVTEPPPGGTNNSGPASRDAQVVEIDKYGIAFELPEGWMTLNAKNLMDSSNPAFREFASRMGMTPKQFVRAMRSSVLTFSITDNGAVEGFVDNVNSVGAPLADLNDDQIKYELAAMGAKPKQIERVPTPVGEIARVPYTLTASGITVHGVGIYVDVGDAVTVITVSSHSPAKAERLGDQIEASLRLTD